MANSFQNYGAKQDTSLSGLGTGTYDQQYQQILDKYAQLAAKRQQANEIAAGNVAAQQRQDNTDWASSGAQGAGIGAGFGPWGALIGGIAGSALGMGKAAQTRMNEGQPWYKALANTALDFKPLTSGRFFTTASSAAPAIAGAVNRANAKNSTIMNRPGGMGYQGQGTSGPLQPGEDPSAMTPEQLAQFYGQTVNGLDPYAADATKFQGTGANATPQSMPQYPYTRPGFPGMR